METVVSCRRNHCFCVGRQLPLSFQRFPRENQLTSFWDDIFAGSDQNETQSETQSETPSGTLGHPKLVFPLTVMQQECDAECDTRCDTGFPSLNPQTNVRIRSRNIIFRYFFSLSASGSIHGNSGFRVDETTVLCWAAASIQFSAFSS